MRPGICCGYGEVSVLRRHRLSDGQFRRRVTATVHLHRCLAEGYHIKLRQACMCCAQCLCG